MAPENIPILIRDLAVSDRLDAYSLTCTPILGHGELEFSGFKAQSGGDAVEPFISEIGTLLPMALCG
ncbi:hypothetical protein, partial [Brucella intermedia]|uniref:hypothetical protein n=1 Tax=Brucella intermedia TaxID=94625 RepID=UPI00128D7B72